MQLCIFYISKQGGNGMKGPNKGLLLTLCCLLLVFVISGCSGGATKSSGQDDGSGQVTLEFWTIALQPTFTDYFNQVIADYEQAHPNVRIEWKDYPYDAI